MTRKVCLFGGGIGWMENFGEKMEMKIFQSVFGWMRRKENKRWDPGVFSPSPPKSSLQNGEKTEEKNQTSFLDKNAHVQQHVGLSTLLYFFFFLFLSSYTLSLITFFFSFFGRLPTHPCSYSFFFFCLDEFFFRHDFYFLINLRD